MFLMTAGPVVVNIQGDGAAFGAHRRVAFNFRLKKGEAAWADFKSTLLFFE